MTIKEILATDKMSWGRRPMRQLADLLDSLHVFGRLQKLLLQNWSIIKKKWLTDNILRLPWDFLFAVNPTSGHISTNCCHRQRIVHHINIGKN